MTNLTDRLKEHMALADAADETRDRVMDEWHRGNIKAGTEGARVALVNLGLAANDPSTVKALCAVVLEGVCPKCGRQERMSGILPETRDKPMRTERCNHWYHDERDALEEVMSK